MHDGYVFWQRLIHMGSWRVSRLLCLQLASFESRPLFLSDVVSWREDEEQKQKRILKVQLDTKPDLQLQH